MKHIALFILFVVGFFTNSIVCGANANLPSYYAEDLIQEDKITQDILTDTQKIEYEYSNGRYAKLHKKVVTISSSPSESWTEEQKNILNDSINEMKEISKNLSELGNQIDKNVFVLYTLFSKRLGKIDAANEFCNIKQPESFSIIEKTNDVSNTFNQDKISFLKRAYNMHKLVAQMVLPEDKNFDCNLQKKYSEVLMSNINDLVILFSDL